MTAIHDRGDSYLAGGRRVDGGRAAFAAVVLLAALLATHPSPAAETLSGEAIMEHVRILADDAMEGRGTGSAGERRAAGYIESQFRKIGLKPAFAGGYVQEVPLVGITADPSTRLTFVGPKGISVARYFDDFSGICGVLREKVVVDSEIVFTGYGVTAPGQNWDDFKDADVRGKVLLTLVNDPPAEDPKHFGGKAMTYYGRWSYKFEEAARRGAAGVLLVHIDKMAGYPWQVVQKSFAVERFQVEGRPDPLLLEGWLQREFVENLLTGAGRCLDELLAAAARPDFKPIPLGIRVQAEINNRIRKLTAPNVAGIVRGTQNPDRFICLVAHHDHFGIGAPDAEGDRIYNGALDNATGVAVVIELARRLNFKKPADSVIFLTVTAEEQGLLGSLYYTLHPAFPLAQTTAAVSIDAVNILGRTSDVEAIGSELSGLEKIANDAAVRLGWKVTPDPFSDRGGFFRSDHFSFARAGVPGISVSVGLDYAGKPAGWGEQKAIDFINKHYHQPSDEITTVWDSGGMVQISEYVLSLVARIGEENGLVGWKEDGEYQRRAAAR